MVLSVYRSIGSLQPRYALIAIESDDDVTGRTGKQTTTFEQSNMSDVQDIKASICEDDHFSSSLTYDLMPSSRGME